jgi:formylmethanofuran dehydrogenase subunit C
VSALTLTLREPPRFRVDCSPLVPDRLAGLSAADIAAIELTSGNARLRAGELFEIGHGDAGDMLIEGDCAKLDCIGAGMGGGRLRVVGDAGDYLGVSMRGGRIELAGSAGSHCACAMSGGTVDVEGSVGDFLGGALPGELQGMRGGLVRVGGGAGERAGDRMRRGMLVIEGDAGDFCASRMAAGTLAVLGRVGADPGFGMVRGTLLVRELRGGLLPTFNDCGIHELGFLSLLLHSWKDLPGAYGRLPPDAIRVRRHVGDLANGGKGEILVWQP